MRAKELESKLGYQFSSPDVLRRAFTHRSWAHEHVGGSEEARRLEENESLEFLGDSVLGLVIAEELYRRYPGRGEGILTLMKHRLVSTATLARLAEELKLGEHLRMGRGEEKTGGRRKAAILADTFEAALGAIFIDGGFTAASEVILRIFEPEFAAVTPDTAADYKTMLQERLQARKMSAPAYELVRTEGRPHDRVFFVEAVWATGRADGSGTSLKAAEMMAASKALKMLDAADQNGAT